MPIREVIFLKKSDNACTHYRVEIPARYLQSKDIPVSLINSVKDIDFSNVKDKIFIFGRSCTYVELESFREIKKQKGIAVYEIDDDLLDLPSWNPASAFFFKVQVVIRNFLREANFVIVTTNSLKKAFLKYNKNILVIDNYIDFDYLNENVVSTIMNKHYQVVPNESLRDRFFLLWGGSITHKVDLKLIEKPLVDFLKKYPEAGLIAIHTINRSIFNAISENQLYAVPAVRPKFYLSLLKSLPANIGLAPLADYPFNHCKSRLKVIEYMATGKIPLASDLTPFTETLDKTIYTNFLTSSSQWFDKFENAFNNWEFSIIKDNLISYAKREFSIERSNWLEVINSFS